MKGYRPPRPGGSDSQARFMQWVWDTLVMLLGAMSSSTVKVSWTTKGPRFEAAAQKGGGGWNWASPPEYDWGTDYVPDQVVIVSSDNEAVTLGVGTPLDFAEAGVYVCVQATNDGTTNIHPPKAQPDPATDADGNWLATVYWVSLSGGGGSPCAIYG